MAHQACSKYLDLKPKLIKCHLCNYLIWLPFPKWANMTRVEKIKPSVGVERKTLLANELYFPAAQVHRVCL